MNVFVVLVSSGTGPEEVRRFVARLAGSLAKGPPLAFGEIKKTMRASLGGTIDTALDMERAGQIRCLHSSDCMEGVSAWIQKREPAFTGK